MTERTDMDGQYEDVWFDVTGLGQVDLDKIDEALDDLDYGDDPIRIMIEPETTAPELGYRISMDELRLLDDGRYAVERASPAIENLADALCPLDPMFACGRRSYDTLTVGVEGVSESAGSWVIPDQIDQMLDMYGASIVDIRCKTGGEDVGMIFWLDVRIE